MSAAQQVLAWLLATVGIWTYLGTFGAWVAAAPRAENWTDERTWGMQCEP